MDVAGGTGVPDRARDTSGAAWDMLGMVDLWDLSEYVWNSPSMYKQWWLTLVREDPGHVVVETALIAIIVYILVFKKTLNPKVGRLPCLFCPSPVWPLWPPWPSAPTSGCQVSGGAEWYGPIVCAALCRPLVAGALPA